MSKFTTEEIQEMAEVFQACVGAEVEGHVHKAFHSYRQEYFVEPESHYQDHLQMQNCMANSDEWKDNHRIITELKEGDELETGVKFAVKMYKREKYVVRKTWQGAVIFGLGVVATQICNLFGVDLPIHKVLTFFK